MNQLLRSTALLAVSLVVALTCRAATGPVRHPSGTDFADLLTALAAWALLASCGWAVALATAAVVETASAGRCRATRWVGCPPALRRALLAGLGVALVGLPASAGAVDRPGRDVPRLAVPARPVGSPAAGAPTTPDPHPASGPPTAPGAALVVRPGDTLWALATDRLPRGASASRVAAYAEVLHRRNAAVIGADPDLIRPGQRLVAPPLHVHPAEETP